ncbi:hypothetical protein ACQ4PT_051159 [Festuca glaucescens]
MSTAAVPSGESSSSRPSWVLVHAYALVGKIRNDTTATASTRNKKKIFASFSRERPPVPSNLHVDCPDGTLRHPPRLLSMADDLILFHAYVGSEYVYPRFRQCDFFIYRADPKRPSLRLLPHPEGRFYKIHQVGVVPRGDEHYTVAALVPDKDCTPNNFLLRLLDSETQVWTSRALHVDSPQRDFPVEIPRELNHLTNYHTTSSVITFGGTMGWADLYRGVVFCDLLGGEHRLRGVPLPLPLKQITASDSSDRVLTNARYTRGIAFINGRLRFVELDFDIVQLGRGLHDKETGWPCSRSESWTITTWSNRELSDSYDDWHRDCTLRACDILVGDCSESGLPLSPPDHGGGDQAAEVEQRGLQNLFMSDPHFGMNHSDGDGDIVYLTARVKFMHPKSWVLAVDMKNRRVQSVVNSGPLPEDHWPPVDAAYCTCSISKWTN